MRKIHLVLVIMVFSCVCPQAQDFLNPGVQNRSNSQEVMKFRVHEYKDAQSGVWAFKLLIPEGWVFNGGITWLPQPLKVCEIHYSVSAPDNSAVMEVMPDIQLWWANDQYTNQALQQQGMNVLQPHDAVNALEKLLIPEIRGSMQNLTIAGRKKLTQASQALTSAAQRMAQSDPCLAQLLAGSSVYYDVGQVDITYTYNGVQIFETFISKIIYVSNPMQPISMWGPEQTVSFATTVAKKRENLEKFVIMYSSAKENPVFSAKLCQINAMMVQEQKRQLANIGELSRYISRTYNEISEMSRSSYEYKNAAYDHVFDQWSDYIRGVDTYSAGGMEVKVPNSSEAVWSKGDEIVFSNNPAFDANRSLDGGWTRMQRK